jgi:hypothetical protein
MVRAKFQLQEVTQNCWSPSGRKLVFSPLYDTSIPEDRRFAQATPSGRFEMQVDNPAALEKFQIGQHYYVDFTPAPKE